MRPLQLLALVALLGMAGCNPPKRPNAGDDEKGATRVVLDLDRPITSPQGRAQEENARKIVTELVTTTKPVSTTALSEAFRLKFNTEAQKKLRDGLAKLGKFTKIGDIHSDAEPGVDYQYVDCIFENGVIDGKVMFNQDQTIGGVWLVEHGTR